MAIKGVTQLRKALVLFFIGFFYKPLYYLLKFFYNWGGKYLILKLYKIYSLLKKHLKINTLKKQILDIFGTRYMVHVVIIIIAILVATSNIKAYERKSPMGKFERMGLVSSLLGPDEFEESQELIEESINIEKIVTKKRALHYMEETRNSLIYQPQSSIKEEEGTGGVIISGDSIASGGGIIKIEKTPQKRTEIVYYTVKTGDTVSSIAKQFNITTNTIIWENNLNKYGFIKPGQKLTILPLTGITYLVKKYDTIGGIAKKYNIKEDEIMEANNIKNASRLQIGQKLIIPGARKTLIPVRKATKVARYAPTAKISRKTVSNIKSSTKLFWPASCSRITQYFHWKHHAIDIACKINTPIRAAEDGVVEIAGWSVSGYGKRIIIRHSNGIRTLYAHLNKIYVRVGQAINRGDVIGIMGSTGRSTGSHLHFEVRIGRSKKNPLSYLR